MKPHLYHLVLLILAWTYLSGCTSVDLPQIEPPESVVAPLPLEDVDLTKIGHLSPKGRVQDKELNDLPVIDELLAHDKRSIPFLISKLDDETQINGQVLDFWYENTVGDVALVILINFFENKDEQTTTIPSVGWDDFLERGNDKDSMGEEILRRYIEKHGRKKIKVRWQKIWDKYGDRIYWEERERVFKVNPPIK